jgi:hypothetical protein
MVIKVVRRQSITDQTDDDADLSTVDKSSLPDWIKLI